MKFIGCIALFVGLMLLEALTVLLGWGWFIAPLGLPEIGYAHALGISAFVGLLTKESTLNDRVGAEKLIVAGLIRIMVYLAFMALYAQFM